MPARRIIPCLDVRAGQVVKGVRFRDHEVVGDIVELATRYTASGADEIVFYDITASPEGRGVDRQWISRVARVLDVPFCVAGGIRTVADAEDVLNRGADKISVNTPALENPTLVRELALRFGSQCVVVGIDSRRTDDGWAVYSHTGSSASIRNTARKTMDWLREVVDLGAGEIVLNCMDQDGVRDGYDIDQLSLARQLCNVPLVASGGAGKFEHFAEVFSRSNVSAALAASVFHRNVIEIPALKSYLGTRGVEVRP